MWTEVWEFYLIAAAPSNITFIHSLSLDLLAFLCEADGYPPPVYDWSYSGVSEKID